MSKKHDKTNQELNDSSTNTEIQIPVKGWADFIRRELKYSESDKNNYHRDLILGVIADKLERICLALEYQRMGKALREMGK